MRAGPWAAHHATLAMRRHRLLTRGPSSEPLWVHLSVYQLADRWVATILAEGVTPPGSSELKGTACFGDTPTVAKKVALRYLGGGVEQN